MTTARSTVTLEGLDVEALTALVHDAGATVVSVERSETEAAPAAVRPTEPSESDREYRRLMRKWWFAAAVGVPTMVLSYPSLLPVLRDAFPRGSVAAWEAGRPLMRRLTTLLLLPLLATACGAAVAGPPPSAGGAAATPTAAAPASVSGQTAGAAGLDPQKNEGGSVEIVATWYSADPPSLKLAMDTHSVDLDRVDPSAVVRVRLDGGAWLAPSTVDAPKGGHHRAAALTFGSVTSAAFASARLVEVRVTDVGIPERLLRWERGG